MRSDIPTFRPRRSILLAPALGFSLFALTGTAAAGDGTEDKANARGLHVILGGGFSYEPVFKGSSVYEFSPDPLIQARFRRLFLGEYGLGIDILQEAGPAELTAGLAVGLGEGRQESDDKAFRGLGDLDQAVELSAFAEAEWGLLEFSGVVSADLASGHKGISATFGVGIEHELTDRLSVEVEASATLGDDTYVRALYGVNETQAARSGYTVFKPGAGFTDASFEATLRYRVTEKWFVQGGGSVGTLLGEARKSPFLSEDVYGTVSFGVGRVFQF